MSGESSANESDTDDGDTSSRRFDTDSALTYLQIGAVAGLAILAFIAAIGVYTSLSAAIELWIDDRYRHLVDAGFNLAVLCAALAGVVAVLRHR
ncbi:MAG: hypothetical protein PPP58_07870 [Natronomonas sp.]